MSSTDEDLLRYYLDELSYLRKQGSRFARAYPKVAGRLELQEDTCPDPHVERLIESFAFLTGRLQSDLDDDFPQVAEQLLNVLYPHYLNPIPSMSIVRFSFPPGAAPTSPVEVARGTTIFTDTKEGGTCRFRTAYDVKLVPLAVRSATILPPDGYDDVRSLIEQEHPPAMSPPLGSALAIKVAWAGKKEEFERAKVNRLRFYLNGETVLISQLYELLFGRLVRVAVSAGSDLRLLEPPAVSPVGFAEEEAVLPYPLHSHPAYCMLQEFFTFPDKFHFFGLGGLKGKLVEDEAVLVFVFSQTVDRALSIGPETFLLGCTPAVNLFPRTSEPIRITHQQHEYPLAADSRREHPAEIHTILRVRGIQPGSERPRDYLPFYSYTHAMTQAEHKAFWHARRMPSPDPEVGGTEMRLSFRDLDFHRVQPQDEVVFADLLCSNRRLAVQLQASHPMDVDAALPVRAALLTKPTPPLDPKLGGQALWRFISHLSLNYLSLDEEGIATEGLKALREILLLYSGTDEARVRQQILGISGMRHRKVMRRLTDGPGFCRGTEVTLEVDDRFYVGNDAFLLTAVLSRFFGLFASTNSFAELVVMRSDETTEWKRWPPYAGNWLLA